MFPVLPFIPPKGGGGGGGPVGAKSILGPPRPPTPLLPPAPPKAAALTAKGLAARMPGALDGPWLYPEKRENPVLMLLWKDSPP